jgi:hypothetical protein
VKMLNAKFVIDMEKGGHPLHVMIEQDEVPS